MVVDLGQTAGATGLSFARVFLYHRPPCLEDVVNPVQGRAMLSVAPWRGRREGYDKRAHSRAKVTVNRLAARARCSA